MGPLQHRLVEGERVVMTLTDMNGRAVSVPMAASYLRAKAWGILADIDPDGVVEAALGNRNASPPAEALRGPLAARILWALHDGPKMVGGIRRLTFDTVTSISTRCREMIEAGLVERINPGHGKGYKAVYAATEAGRAYLASFGVRT